MDENSGERNGHGSAVSLEHTLDAVAGVGRELNAVTSAMDDRARALARKSAEREAAGEPDRPLEGTLFAIKDVIDVAGFPTTMGSKVSSGPEPSTTAPAVHLLERAGGIPVAKTNCHEYSYGILGDESAFGRVVNPVDPALCTAGSSSGSAALVAAGVVPLALGTDTAGSVRVPAACQGIIGFKPTFGTVSTEGVFPLSPSFDTVGLFGREISVIAAAYAAITGTDPEASADKDSQADTVTIDLGLLDSAGASAAGARTWTKRHLPNARTTSANTEELLRIIDDGLEIYDIVRRYEAYVLHEKFIEEQGELYQPGVWAKIMSGQHIAEADYRSQVFALEELRASAAAIFDDVDFIITPAIDGDVIRWDEIGAESASRFMRYSLPFNVLGWPAVTLPVGAVSGKSEPESESKSPIGAKPESGSALGAKAEMAIGTKPESVQIVGPPHSDLRLLDFLAGF